MTEDNNANHETDLPEEAPPESDPPVEEFRTPPGTAGPESQGLVDGLESSLHDPIKPIVYIPEEERFPPLEHDSIPEDEAAPADRPAATRPPPKRHRLQGGDWRHNLVALFFMLLTIALCGYIAAFWQDPYGAWNPLAIPTEYQNVTWTPDVRALADQAGTQTAEAIPTEAPIIIIDTPMQATSAPIPETATAAPLLMPFTLAEPGVIYTPNANGRGCNWASIGGTVTGLQGEPLNNYKVNIINAEAPDQLNVQAYSGGAATFGEGGYELYLGGSPRDGQYIVQLLSETDVPLSDEFLIFTHNLCAENVAVVNFVQILDQ